MIIIAFAILTNCVQKGEKNKNDKIKIIMVIHCFYFMGWSNYSILKNIKKKNQTLTPRGYQFIASVIYLFTSTQATLSV